MTGVRSVTVSAADDGLRLDRWFREHEAALPFGQLQKLLRTGQIRLDGKRAKANTRIATGQVIRIPPYATDEGKAAAGKPERRTVVQPGDETLLAERIVYMDNRLIVIDKPAGLAVQGGAGTHRHVDGLLDTLRFDHDERPRLVHRIDKDTSGLLALARDRKTAQELTRAFQTRQVRKLYWAITVGVPRQASGRIDAPLAKIRGGGSEKMVVDEQRGDKAVTEYRVVAQASRSIAWLALEPLTGRTHQLRAHLAAIGTPILGDGKYGGAAAHPDIAGIRHRMQLHARALRIEFDGGRVISVEAPPPPHMAEIMRLFELEDSGGLANFLAEIP